MPHRYAFPNTNELDTVYNAKNRSWQGIHNVVTTEKNKELFKTDLIVQGNSSSDGSTRITIRAVLPPRDARIITIFPTGNDIDLKHRLTIFNIFFKF